MGPFWGLPPTTLPSTSSDNSSSAVTSTSFRDLFVMPQFKHIRLLPSRGAGASFSACVSVFLGALGPGDLALVFPCPLLVGKRKGQRGLVVCRLKNGCHVDTILETKPAVSRGSLDPVIGSRGPDPTRHSVGSHPIAGRRDI